MAMTVAQTKMMQEEADSGLGNPNFLIYKTLQKGTTMAVTQALSGEEVLVLKELALREKGDTQRVAPETVVNELMKKGMAHNIGAGKFRPTDEGKKWLEELGKADEAIKK